MKRLLGLGLMIGLFAPILAQQPAPGAGGSSSQPPQVAPQYGLPISLAQAKQLAALVATEAAKVNASRYVLAIVQPSGDLVYFEKSDASTFVSIEYALAKARMAARYRTASGNLPPNAGSLPDSIGLTGGMPLVFQGRTVGAIGISGVEGGGDVRLAQLAAASLL